MSKIKLTKNELKKQKDALKMYERYLPTLQLKKQQLQVEIRGVEARLDALLAMKESLEKDFRSWIAVFSEAEKARLNDGLPILRVTAVRTSVGNIAGVPIPLFDGADFEFLDYDYFSTPLWVDSALKLMQGTPPHRS